MDKSSLHSWVEKLGKAWSKRDPKAAALLFAKECEYYESVLQKPITDWNDILKLWLVVPKNQKNVVFNFKVLGISDGFGIINWKVKRMLLPSNEKQIIDGVFQVSLNKKGLCKFFKQWRTSKNY